MTVENFLGRKIAEFDPPVRGDPITGDRYFTKEWMDKEWDQVWTKIWHVGGMAYDLEEAGDYIMHKLRHESVIMVRQQDGGIKAFYNACPHRGNRLVIDEIGGAPRITCAYHGWQFEPNGTLVSAQDPDDFAGGNPCGKTKLVEIPCDTWAGFVWFSMDKNAKPLRQWLAPLPDLLEGYALDKQMRVQYIRTELDCNWKIIRDNFNESYHVPTLHPELATFINDDHTDTIFEMFPGGHNRMVMKGMQPSARSQNKDRIEAPLDAMMLTWGLDPKDYAGRTYEIRTDAAKAMREQGPARGYDYFANLTDSQLTDYYHCTFFPNVTLTVSSDGFQLLRTEPHPTDPEKCIFDHWFMVPAIPGRTEIDAPVARVPFKNAERVDARVGVDSVGFVADQDVSCILTQQQGLHSRGYTGGVLPIQEKRIQRFHELLDDWVAGKVGTCGA